MSSFWLKKFTSISSTLAPILTIRIYKKNCDKYLSNYVLKIWASANIFPSSTNVSQIKLCKYLGMSASKLMSFNREFLVKCEKTQMNKIMCQSDSGKTKEVFCLTRTCLRSHDTVFWLFLVNVAEMLSPFFEKFPRHTFENLSTFFLRAAQRILKNYQFLATQQFSSVCLFRFREFQLFVLRQS